MPDALTEILEVVAPVFQRRLEMAARAASRPEGLATGLAVSVRLGLLPERRKDWTLYPDEYRFGFTFTRRP